MRLTIALVSLLLFCCNAPKENPEFIIVKSIDSVINDIQQKYAPDKRTAVFTARTDTLDEYLIIKGETNIKEAKSELLTQLKRQNLPVIDGINLLPDRKLKDKTYGVIDISVSNNRTEPRHQSELTTQAISGTPVNVLKYHKNGWYYVQTPDKYLSWVDTSAITCMTKKKLEQWICSPQVIYMETQGYAYSKPDEKSPTVFDITIGSRFKQIGSSGKYYKIQTPGDRNGFVKKDDVALFTEWIDTIHPDNKNIVNTAKRFMGIPYLWGGTSSKAMDCSGFTQMVYYLNGVLLPRDASQQILVGELVDEGENFENLQYGDLLFFGFEATENKKEKVKHVAISLGGKEFIHADGRVRINSLSPKSRKYSEYLRNLFLRAKRMTNCVGKNGVITLKSLLCNETKAKKDTLK